MNNKKVQLIVMNAMIGAAYAVLTILISPIAYGAVQMRLTEIIVLLACYNKKFIPGLTIGCLLANLASPMGLYDICFGTAATLIACLGMYYVKNVCWSFNWWGCQWFNRWFRTLSSFRITIYD